MNEDAAKLNAHKVSRLYLTLNEITVDVSTAMRILEDTQHRIIESTMILEELMDSLPREVKEDVLDVSLSEEQTDSDETSLVGLLKKILGR